MNVRVDRQRRRDAQPDRPTMDPDATAARDLAWVRTACPWLFLVLCLASALFQVWHMPPFQGPDELAHAYRIDLATFGQPVAERVHKKNVVAGGATDLSLYEATLPFDNIRFNSNEKADVVDFTAADRSRWDGRTTRTGYPGSAIYPPFFYLPQAAGLALGKFTKLPVVQSLYLARAANALTCILLGFAALLIAGRARLLMFSLLLLPMSVAVYSTMGNDGLMVATTALGCAVISRGMYEGRPLRGSEVMTAAVCFALIGMTKLPYMFIGLVFLVCPVERPRWRWIGAATVIGCSIAWTLWMSFVVQTALTAPGGPVDPARQVHYLLTHPLDIWSIGVATLKANWRPYVDMFVGVLGWLDTSLPPGYHRAAWVVLGLALLASLSRGRPREWRWVPPVALGLVVLVFGAIHGALYVTWTDVAAKVVSGVQGRYLIPLALMACLAVEGARPLLPRTRAGVWAYRVMAAVVLAFPLISMLIVEHAIIVRYYLD